VFAHVFSYEARDPEEFERVYGPDGEWARFFHGGRGYIGTELLRDVDTPGRYLLVDRWETRERFDEFAATHRDEYVRRSDDTQLHYVQELRLGSFESAG
jgi:heme-degrading monooxygenase HmoA